MKPLSLLFHVAFPSWLLAIFLQISYNSIKLRFNLPPIEGWEFWVFSIFYTLVRFNFTLSEKKLKLIP